MKFIKVRFWDPVDGPMAVFMSSAKKARRFIASASSETDFRVSRVSLPGVHPRKAVIIAALNAAAGEATTQSLPDYPGEEEHLFTVDGHVFGEEGEEPCD